MKKNILNKDYKEEIANVIESRNFTQNSANLLLNMVYRIDDGYENYQTVKRDVPRKGEFFENVINELKHNCSDIIIAEPNTNLEKELKKSKCTILTEGSSDSLTKRVISYPNEKTLLYGITKAGVKPLRRNASAEEKAVMTTLNIGKCISTAEVLRDFNGWAWSVIDKEVESTECNVVYVFISMLMGYEFASKANYEMIEKTFPKKFMDELKKVSIQFFMSYDKEENEAILKNLADNKRKLAKMKNQSSFVAEIAEKKKAALSEIRKIDELLNDSKMMKKSYLAYNKKMPAEKKIFSVSHYEDIIEKLRVDANHKLEELNKLQNPVQFMEARDRLEYQIKFYEEKTDISKFEKEFIKLFEEKIKHTTDKKKILDLIYQVRYLNFLPNCKMNLERLKEILIPLAIKHNVLAPISNNDKLDYKILKGLFDSQVVALDNLTIKLASRENVINVELYEGNTLDRSYNVVLPEGSNIEIRKTKKTKIFGK